MNQEGTEVFKETVISNMKVMVIEIKLSIKEYLDKIKPYLKAIINNFKNYDTWEIQLTIAINF